MGTVTLPNTHAFAHYPGGFKCSPLLQEKLVYIGQLNTFQKASEIAAEIGGLKSSDSTIHRLCQSYGQAVEEELYAEQAPQAATTAEQEVLYAQLDGGMVFTDEKWKEVKLGRVYRQELDGASVQVSTYAAHLGAHPAFCDKFTTVIEGARRGGERPVFLSDGARWIGQWIARKYPGALHILDFYHAAEHLNGFAKQALAPAAAGAWYAQRRVELRQADGVHKVMRAIRALEELAPGGQAARLKLLTYLTNNESRMDYFAYRQAGYIIGSGAIESAHRTVVQARLKLSGQRWSMAGAQQMLNLRVAYMSGRKIWLLTLSNGRLQK